MIDEHIIISDFIKPMFFEKGYLKSKISLVFFAFTVLVFTSCSRFECKRLALKEDLPELELFIDFIENSNIDLYNSNTVNSRCYRLDSLIVFVTFNSEYKRDSSVYLLEIQKNLISIFKPLEKLAETYELGTEHRLYFEVKGIIDENIIDDSTYIYIDNHYNYIHKLYRGSDSLLNFIGLWHGRNCVNKYNYFNRYFYVEWLTEHQVIQHYTLMKSIKCDTKFIFDKTNSSNTPHGSSGHTE